MERETIRRQVAALVANLAKDKDCLDTKEHDGEFLTGDRFDLDAGKLVYLYYDIKNAFQIEISVPDMEGYQFATIDGITDLVDRKMRQVFTP